MLAVQSTCSSSPIGKITTTFITGARGGADGHAHAPHRRECRLAAVTVAGIWRGNSSAIIVGPPLRRRVHR
jgi:hypothetical protein